jgi:hypothetical protein
MQLALQAHSAREPQDGQAPAAIMRFSVGMDRRGIMQWVPSRHVIEPWTHTDCSDILDCANVSGRR